MTESAGLGARQPVARPRRAGSVGVPAPGLSVQIVGEDGVPCAAGEPGEIRVSGAAVFPGYLFDDDPSPFDAEGRLCTGDVGFLDANGELCVRGRLAFALTVGDRVVCAEEVEAVMAGHPAVVAAAAAPFERAFGVLVVSRDASASTLEELRQHAQPAAAGLRAPAPDRGHRGDPADGLGQDRPPRGFTMAGKRARDRLIRAALRAARDHATPFYLFDRQGARENIRRWRGLAGDFAEVFYPYKCNRHPALLDLAQRGGLGAEVTVAADVEQARSHLSGERIVFQGPAKDPRSLLRVLASGGWVVADSPEDAAATLSAAADASRRAEVSASPASEVRRAGTGAFRHGSAGAARARAAHLRARACRPRPGSPFIWGRAWRGPRGTPRRSARPPSAWRALGDFGAAPAVLDVGGGFPAAGEARRDRARPRSDPARRPGGVSARDRARGRALGPRSQGVRRARQGDRVGRLPPRDARRPRGGKNGPRGRFPARPRSTSCRGAATRSRPYPGGAPGRASRSPDRCRSAWTCSRRANGSAELARAISW